MTARNHLAPLTSFRFFAALMVLFQHYFGFRYGHAGVSFFYILSGFILTYNYEGNIDRTVSRRIFYWKRFARVYPTHLVTLLIAFPLDGAVTKGLLAKFIINMLLLQSFFPYSPVYFSFNAPAWSISDEAFFYGLFPILLTRMRRRIVWPLGVLSLIICCAWMYFRRDPSMNDPVTHWLFYIDPFFRILEFAIGIALGKSFKAGNSALGTIHEIAAIGLCAATLITAYYLPQRAGVLLLAEWFIPGAAVLVHTFSRSNGAVARMLSTTMFVRLGEASFMLYMIHTLVLAYGIIALGSSLPAKAILAMVSIAAAMVAHRIFEMPVQKHLTSAPREVAATAP